MSDKKQYADRDIMTLDRQGGYYIRHTLAMTEEGLHDKSDIAAELAWRDSLICSLIEAADRMLCDGLWVGDEWVTSDEAREMAEIVLAKARGGIE